MPAKKTTSPTPPAPTAKAVKVTVARQPINEGGVHYAPGTELELSPARVAALGSLVLPAAPNRPTDA
jgi:hypothetical protein